MPGWLNAALRWKLWPEKRLSMHGSKLLELPSGTLDRIQQRTPSVFAFREMPYDFTSHSEQPMVQATDSGF